MQTGSIVIWQRWYKTTKEIKVGVDCIMIHLFWSDAMWSIVGLGGRDSTVL